jgi:hypothetical protein
MHARASSEQACEPMAPSSVNICRRKTRTVPTPPNRWYCLVHFSHPPLVAAGVAAVLVVAGVASANATIGVSYGDCTSVMPTSLPAPTPASTRVNTGKIEAGALLCLGFSMLLPSVFGRKLQCELVRKVDTREECHWSHACSLQANMRGNQCHPRVWISAEKRAPYLARHTKTCSLLGVLLGWCRSQARTACRLKDRCQAGIRRHDRLQSVWCRVNPTHHPTSTSTSLMLMTMHRLHSLTMASKPCTWTDIAPMRCTVHVAVVMGGGGGGHEVKEFGEWHRRAARIQRGVARNRWTYCCVS